jgi:rhamnulokinase
MKNLLNLIGMDFGASSGRGIAGLFNGQHLSIKEFHRFGNNPITAETGTLEWDFGTLYSELIKSLQIFASTICRKPDSLAIDTWGVDFGLLNVEGDLLQNPLHYRNYNTSDLLDDVFALIDQKELFSRNGTAFYTYTTLFQLFRIHRSNPELITKAQTLLMIPDLFLYLLTKEKGAEFTVSSTSGLLDLGTPAWNTELIKDLEMKEALFPSLYVPGDVHSALAQDVLDKSNLSVCKVSSTPSHDTASAVLAVPAEMEDFAYLSSGTWSLIGVELEKPVMSEDAMRRKYTNERGAFGEYRFLKNIMGLWLVQEYRRNLSLTGKSVSFSEMVELACKTLELSALIDPDHPVFFEPGRMKDKICAYCMYTGQKCPESVGEFVRCILESLAFTYKHAVDDIKSLSGRTIKCLHIVGGGSQNNLLNQCTANALGIPVVAGPVEAAVIGNIAMQLKALGEVSAKDEIRSIVRRSFKTTTFVPNNSEKWNSAYEKYKEICHLGINFKYEK